jgi:ubiquinone/menaquinone biosynthesis C-methylase UbiE
MKNQRDQTMKVLAKTVTDAGTDPWTRTLTAVYLFDFMDRMLDLKFPRDWPARLEKETAALVQNLDSLKQLYQRPAERPLSSKEAAPANHATAEKTGSVYAQLWKPFSPAEYFEQAHRYLQERFERNQVQPPKAAYALDDGCGGGRYSVALKKMGCRKVVGLDVSPDAIAQARQRNPFKPDEVDFVNASVLELPFENEQFDFVFSNGVLHHTVSTEKGLQEIYRVLKKGGACWLYLYGGKESFFWDVVDACRALVHELPQPYVARVMEGMGYVAGRIFHRLDFWFVPLHRRYFEREVVDLLRDAGFTTFRRLHRGAAHDWDEIIHANPSLDSYWFGEGEMRFWLNK